MAEPRQDFSMMDDHSLSQDKQIPSGEPYWVGERMGDGRRTFPHRRVTLIQKNEEGTTGQGYCRVNGWGCQWSWSQRAYLYHWNASPKKGPSYELFRLCYLPVNLLVIVVRADTLLLKAKWWPACRNYWVGHGVLSPLCFIYWGSRTLLSHFSYRRQSWLCMLSPAKIL